MSFQVNQTFLDFIFVGGITLNVLVLLLLFRSHYKELHGKLMIAIFLTTLLSILFAYSFLHEIRWLLLLSWMIIQSAAWYSGPLLLLYIKSLYQPTKGLVRRNILHFLPAVLFMVFISFPSLKSILDKEYLFRYVSFIMEEGSAIVEIAQILFLGLYCVVALRELFQTEHLIKKVYANLEGLGIQWIYFLLTGMLAVCFLLPGQAYAHC